MRLGRPDPARHALAAGLVAEEPQHVGGGGEQVGALGHHDQRARPEHRPGLPQRAEVQRHVELVRPEEVGRGAARLDGAEPPAAGHPAGQVEQLTGGRPHRHAVDPGALDVAGDREELQPVMLPRALLLPPGGSPPGDDRDMGERLDRVHQRRLAVQAVHAGEGRLVARLAPVPLHALDQGRLLAEDVAARRGEHLHRQPPPGPDQPGPDQPGPDQSSRAQPVDLAADHRLLRAVLVPDEHPAFLGPGREHPEQHALQHQVRLVGQDLPVLERPRLGLVGVADRVLRRRGLRRDQLPLPAGREPGAAHAAQPDVGQGRGDLPGVQGAGEHVAQHPVVLRRRGVRVVGPPPVTGLDGPRRVAPRRRGPCRRGPPRSARPPRPASPRPR